ncbi:P-loop containing nucleoside triphosphate hydrolase protein, partial [Globomyces pollinis-pini]
MGSKNRYSQCIADYQGYPSPQAEASTFSRLTYQWINPLLKLGSEKFITEEDLYSVSPNLRSEKVNDIFKKSWELMTARGNQMTGTFKLFNSLILAFGYPFLKSGILLATLNALSLVSPFLLQYFLEWLQDTNSDKHQGLVYAISLFIIQGSISFLNSWQFELASTTGLRIRTALATEIFHKSLKLTCQSKAQFPAGKIMNLSSTDCVRLEEACEFLHMLWIAPLVMVAGTFLLYRNLGISALLGFSFLMFYIPIQIQLSKLMVKYRKRSNSYTDSRLKYLHEILQGIKVIKIYTWEEKFMELLAKVRSIEIGESKKFAIIGESTAGMTQTVPAIAMLFTFISYALMGNELTASKIVPSLSIFYALRTPIMYIPFSLDYAINSWISLGRISSFLAADELLEETVNETTTNSSFELKNVNFSWKMLGDTDFKLNDINLDIPKGTLVAVVGSVASGKSSLLNALMGEMEMIEGDFKKSGTISYCPQQAWIQTGTLRENITFGLAMDHKRYDSVINMCCLQSDFDNMPNGDLTEIIESGANLSGGQKQRISLARAVYSNRDIFLLDDPLSAVDNNVGNKLFNNCILDGLKGKTRIFVTHHLQYIAQADFIIHIDDGRIIGQGTYDGLMGTSEPFANLFKNAVNENSTSSESEAIIGGEIQNQIILNTDTTKITVDEEQSTGQISIKVILEYIKYSGGLSYCVLIFTWIVVCNLARISTDQWLAFWIEDKFHLERREYMIGYAILCFSQTLFNIGYALTVTISGLNASKSIHKAAFRNICHYPLSFFNTTPLGQIMNRFSNDVNILDTLLPQSIRITLSSSSNAISNLILIIVYLPSFSIPALAILFAMYQIQRFYMATARELKRINLISLSPCMSYLSETLNGYLTIRTFNKSKMFESEYQSLLDTSNKSAYLIIIIQRWLELRLELLNSTILLFVTLLAVSLQHKMSPSIIGILVTYSIQITQMFTWVVNNIIMTENYFSSTERMLVYTNDLVKKSDQVHVVPENWPTQGKIVADAMSLRYDTKLPAVLDKISFEISPGEAIAVVGRTGAGKSSLFNCFLRLFELENGSLIIDDLDISTITAKRLREGLSVIPQEPILFSGTLRFNIDPIGQYEDKQIWDVLDSCSLREYVNQLPQALESEIEADGSNWSMGHRQLVCLARAMLKNSKIVLLDEATASMDFQTDRIIQNVIRTQFKDSTVITIAHRLDTIVDYDKIMVLSFGKVVEFDTPTNLMKNSSSDFYQMVVESGQLQSPLFQSLLI